MADPLSWAAMGMTVAGGVTTALGQGAAGEAEANRMRYLSQVAENNRVYQLQAGDVTAQRSLMKTRFEIGQATADQGRSGLDVATGSAPLVRGGIHDVGTQEAGIIRSDAARRAYGEQEQEKLDVMAGTEAERAARVAETGTFIKTAGSIADKWAYGKQVGLGSTGRSPIDLYGPDQNLVGSV